MTSRAALQTYVKTTPHGNVLLLLLVPCTTRSPGTASLHGTEPWGEHLSDAKTPSPEGWEARTKPTAEQGWPAAWCEWNAHETLCACFMFRSRVLKQKIMRPWSEGSRTLVGLLRSVISAARHPTNGGNPSLGLGTRLLDTRLSVQPETTLTSAPSLLYS